MTTLNEIREDIDRADETIVNMLTARVLLAKLACIVKKDNKLPIIDAEREAAVLKHVGELATERGISPMWVQHVFEEIITVTRIMQVQ